MFFNYTAEQYEMQYTFLFSAGFLTEERYNRGYVRQIWLFSQKCKRGV
jgi:hypothetical protein